MLSEDKILPTYEQYLKEEGIQPTTREGYNSSITSLINASVNLFNPSSVKEYLASKSENEMTNGRKRNIKHAYQHFYKLAFGKEWKDAPKYKRVKKPQYLPTEEHLLQIIAGVPNKYKPFCQLLYETGISSAEAWQLRWDSINFETLDVDVTPIKNRNPRTLPISHKLSYMIQLLPRNTEYIFKKGLLDNFREGFRRHRKKLAEELNEPEIRKCSFKTFRTFYITRLSYDFDSSWEVQYRAGHTQMSTTQLYIRRELSMNKGFVSKTTRTLEEEQQAIEQGFEYVKDREGVSLWRKPK